MAEPSLQTSESFLKHYILIIEMTLSNPSHLLPFCNFTFSKLLKLNSNLGGEKKPLETLMMNVTHGFLI